MCVCLCWCCTCRYIEYYCVPKKVCKCVSVCTCMYGSSILLIITVFGVHHHVIIICGLCACKHNIRSLCSLQQSSALFVCPVCWYKVTSSTGNLELQSYRLTKEGTLEHSYSFKATDSPRKAPLSISTLSI